MQEEKIEETKSSWIKTKPEELEKMIIEMAKEGKTPSQIGITLRDKHGIPKAKILGKKITQVLKERKISFNDDKKQTDNQVEKLKVHISKNKHDYPATRSLTKNLWVLYHLNKKA